VAPKFVPVMATEDPAAPAAGASDVIAGGTRTVKLAELLAMPPTVTTTGPLVAPAGTGTTMLVGLQEVGTAAVPLKATVLVPWVAPKFVPVIVTGTLAPCAPDVGESEVIVGAGAFTANVVALVPPLVVTVTFATPTGAAGLTANVAMICVLFTTVTLLTEIPVLSVASVTSPIKRLPVIVTRMVAPGAAEEGLTKLICGGPGVTVKGTNEVPAPVVTATDNVPNATPEPIVKVAAICVELNTETPLTRTG